MVDHEGQRMLILFLLIWLCFTLFVPFQDQEENKGATSWPEFYIDQLNSMAAVSIPQSSGASEPQEGQQQGGDSLAALCLRGSSC